MTKIRFVGELTLVPYNKIVAPDDNVRQSLTGIDELAASILQVGLLQPLTVEAEGGKYVITSGFRRHAAIGQLIKAKQWTGPVDVHVRAWDDESQRLVAMLIENLQRVDLDPVDEAFGIQRLAVEHGIDAKDIATRLNRSVAHVKERLALCALPDEGLELLRKGELTIGVAVAIAKAPADVQPKILKNRQHYYNESAVSSFIADANRNALKKKLTAVIKEFGIDKLEPNYYSTPAGFMAIGATSEITTEKAMRSLLTERGTCAGWKVALSNACDGKFSVAIYCPKSEDAKAAEEAKAIDKRDAQAQHVRSQQQRDREQLPDDAARKWFDKMLTIEAQTRDAEEALTKARLDQRHPFLASLTTKEVSSMLLMEAAASTARTLANAAHQYTTAWGKREWDTIVSALGVGKGLAPEFINALKMDDVMAMVTANAKILTLAAAYQIMIRGRSLDAQFQAHLEMAGAIEAEPTMPTLPPSLIPFYNNEEPYDIDSFEGIVYAATRQTPVSEEERIA